MFASRATMRLGPLPRKALRNVGASGRSRPASGRRGPGDGSRPVALQPHEVPAWRFLQQRRSWTLRGALAYGSGWLARSMAPSTITIAAAQGNATHSRALSW